MKRIKLFEDYLNTGVARKIKPDAQRSEHLILESKRKMVSLTERLEKIGIKDANANDYVEYCYDIIMLLVRSKLYQDGYIASGPGAHTAEVAYLHVLGFEEKDVQFLDKIRYFRNGILYYGTTLDAEYAQKVVEFTEKISERFTKVM